MDSAANSIRQLFVCQVNEFLLRRVLGENIIRTRNSVVIGVEWLVSSFVWFIFIRNRIPDTVLQLFETY